jgi:hypothetical protein
MRFCWIPRSVSSIADVRQGKRFELEVEGPSTPWSCPAGFSYGDYLRAARSPGSPR